MVDFPFINTTSRFICFLVGIACVAMLAGFLAISPAHADSDVTYVCYTVGTQQDDGTTVLDEECMDVDDLVASIECSTDNTCDDAQSRVPESIRKDIAVVFGDKPGGSTSGSPWQYDACCTHCDISVPSCSGCNSGKKCPKGEEYATCQSDSNGTYCWPGRGAPPHTAAVNLSDTPLDPDPLADDDVEDPVSGCCAFCPEGDYCQYCASSNHEYCGALAPADCALVEDVFQCNPAEDRPGHDDIRLTATPPDKPLGLTAPAMPEPTIPGASDATAPMPSDAVPQAPSSIPAAPMPSPDSSAGGSSNY